MAIVTLTIDESHPSAEALINFLATLDFVTILEMDGEKYDKNDYISLDTRKIELVKRILEIKDGGILNEMQAILDKELV